MANSINLTVVVDPNAANPNPYLPNSVYVTASDIQWFRADTTSPVANVVTTLNIKLTINNSKREAVYLSSTTLSALTTAFPTFIPLVVYQNLEGTAPTGGAGTTYYYNPAVIQFFYADATTGVGSVASQVNIMLQKGNGTTSGNILVSNTASAIATALG